jgi:hypothetical protein
MLGIKAHTVHYHKYRITELFHLRTSADIFTFTIKQGIVELGGEPAHCPKCGTVFTLGAARYNRRPEK